MGEFEDRKKQLDAVDAAARRAVADIETALEAWRAEAKAILLEIKAWNRALLDMRKRERANRKRTIAALEAAAERLQKATAAAPEHLFLEEAPDNAVANAVDDIKTSGLDSEDEDMLGLNAADTVTPEPVSIAQWLDAIHEAARDIRRQYKANLESLREETDSDAEETDTAAPDAVQ